MSKRVEHIHFNIHEPPFSIQKPQDIRDHGVTRWTIDLANKSRGGLGEVFYGWDRKLAKRIACKVLYDISSQDRLQREAQQLAHIRHPNIVDVYDYVEEHGKGYLIMEYIYPGKSIQELLSNNHIFTGIELVQMIHSVADAIDYLHKKKIVHRDIKPGNILAPKGNPTKLIDFGLTRNVYSEDALSIVGTMFYMSPEAKTGKDKENFHIERMRDIYALGVTFLECLFGSPEDAIDAIEDIHRGIDLPSDKTSLLTRRYGKDTMALLMPVIKRVLKRDPADRFQTAAEFAREVEKAFQKKNLLFFRR